MLSLELYPFLPPDSFNSLATSLDASLGLPAALLLYSLILFPSPLLVLLLTPWIHTLRLLLSSLSFLLLLSFTGLLTLRLPCRTHHGCAEQLFHLRATAEHVIYSKYAPFYRCQTLCRYMKITSNCLLQTKTRPMVLLLRLRIFHGSDPFLSIRHLFMP